MGLFSGTMKVKLGLSAGTPYTGSIALNIDTSSVHVGAVTNTWWSKSGSARVTNKNFKYDASTTSLNFNFDGQNSTNSGYICTLIDLTSTSNYNPIQVPVFSVMYNNSRLIYFYGWFDSEWTYVNAKDYFDNDIYEFTKKFSLPDNYDGMFPTKAIRFDSASQSYLSGVYVNDEFNSASETIILNNKTNVLGLDLAPIQFECSEASGMQPTEITVNNIKYDFPVNTNIDISSGINVKIANPNAPDITVDYTNTSKPVITNTERSPSVWL